MAKNIEETLEKRKEQRTQDEITDYLGNKVTGEELFQRYLMGDQYAFEDLVTLYEADVSRFINSKLNDYHETKYLTIEVFGQLAVSGRKFSGKSTLKTYIFTIARHLVGKHLKTRSKNDHISYDEIVYEVSDNSQTPDAYMEQIELKQQLHECMKELKDEYYRTLKLLYFEDMSYRQAGAVFGKSEKQIKDLAYRAKASLKKKLEESNTKRFKIK